MLEVKNLVISLKKKEKTINAVNDISFSVNAGEIVGLAGETGCGKTLAALAVAGLLPAKAKIKKGQIIYKGQDLTSLNAKEFKSIRGKEISMIFQETRQSLNPLLKAGFQISEALFFSGEKNKELNKKKTFETLAALGFDDPSDIYNAYPHQLSGGMCQRVVAAMALIKEPELLLADEPSSSLDSESQARILSVISERNKKNKMSVLIISHDLGIIRDLADRFLVMYAGRIVERGEGKTLFSPLHPYTKALVGAIPDISKRGKKLENIPGKVPSVEDNITGCPFAPRCKKARDLCSRAFPPARKINNAEVSCYFPEIGESDE